MPLPVYVMLWSDSESYLAGYSEFLSKQVGSEVRNLPRGVYHTSARRLGVETNQSKTLETLPAFLQQQYDKCRQPGLRPGLAGLFVCSVVLSTASV